MSEEIRQIAERLVGLRDALDLRPEDIASTCNIDLETYLGYESGEKDIPVSFLHQIAKHYGVELPALMFGYEPRMNSYFLTRKDKGVAVERTNINRWPPDSPTAKPTLSWSRSSHRLPKRHSRSTPTPDKNLTLFSKGACIYVSEKKN